MTEKITTNKKGWGLTTGTCAAAAAKAAVSSLYSDKIINSVEIKLPAGEKIKLDVFEESRTESTSNYYAIKPVSDDPDITKNIKIFAKAKKTTDIKIDAGDGIGKITKPGLATEVGKPAINPVPLKMINDEVIKALPKNKGASITISAPAGKELAAKTFNERLGIVGGISILGTTGFVKPMSVDAYKTSLGSQIDIALAGGYKEIIITPGNIGKKAALDNGFEKEAIIICSNFIGYILDLCKNKNVDKITIIGHPGKLLKVADGHFNTHSDHCQLNLDLLSPFLTEEKIKTLNSAEEAIQLLSTADLNKIALQINNKIQNYLNGQVQTKTLLINLKSKIVGASNE